MGGQQVMNKKLNSPVNGFREDNNMGFRFNLQRFADSIGDTPSDDVAHTQDTPSTSDDAHTTPDTSSKTFTQEELDAIVKDRVAREKRKLDEEKSKFEQEKELAKLSEKERAAKEFELEKERFESERQEFQRNKLKLDTIKDLSERNLHPDFADYLLGDSPESTHENIMGFETIFNKAVEKALEDRLKGKTPSKTSGATGITQEDFDKMGYTERVQLKKTQPELYKTFTQIG